MDRPRRESRQHNGITVRGSPQPTFATKSVNLRRTQREQMSSGLHSIADIARYGRHVANVPEPTFGAGFLAITSNARRAERSNDRCLVLPHRPGLLARQLPRGITDMIVGPPWHNLRTSSAALPFFERMPTSWCGPIQYWPSVRCCEMNFSTVRRVPRTMILRL
jgi:hypothetical protein